MALGDRSQFSQFIGIESQPQVDGLQVSESAKGATNAAESSAAFFRRNGFDVRTKDACDHYAHRQFPGYHLTAVEPQGYCSYTLNVGEAQVIQFRPTRFQLGSHISDEAREIFGNLVPAITYLGVVCGIPAVAGGADEDNHLHVYVLERIKGIPLAVFREEARHRPVDEVKMSRRRLVEDIAAFFAIGLREGHSSLSKRHFWNVDKQENFTKGYVWRTLEWRMALLKKLPGAAVRRYVLQAQKRQAYIEGLTWCLTHGDMIPANVMVDPATGHLTGLIDWAEGEWLPFGIGLYGLEELLGEETTAHGFRYYDEHDELRQLFWKKLMESSACKKLCLEDVGLARKLGIMLWRGIAFEDGRIDQVVEAGRDDVDIAKLDAFLQVDDGLGAYVGRRRTSMWAQQIWEALRGYIVRLFGFAQRKDKLAASKIASMASSATD